MGANESRYVQEAFDTNWIAPLGPHVNGFEADLQNYLQIGHAAALSSGTAAIHLALELLEVSRGDEVLCQSFTFCGSANPILYQGATPIFIDSEAKTWNMCPESLRKAIKERLAKGKKIKAILPVHLYGMPAQMAEIQEIANEYEIPVVEDAAEALGSHVNGKKCGTFGQMGVLSFNGNKIITTSGGGALVGADEDMIQKARFLATQARDNAPHYQHSKLGYNYRLSNVLAGIGRGQMEVLEERVAQKRRIYAFHQQTLGEVNGITFLDEPEGYFSNRWLSAILIDEQKTGFSREEVRLALEKENIEARPLWKPMHLQPLYENQAFYGSGLCNQLFEQGLCLPSDTKMGETEFQRIKDCLQAFTS